MFTRAVRRLRSTLRSFTAFRRGWRWEKDHHTSVIPLSNGTWSKLNGGQIWRRRNGEGYDYKQARNRS